MYCLARCVQPIPGIDLDSRLVGRDVNPVVRCRQWETRNRRVSVSPNPGKIAPQ
jgi:hypothetical protein